MPNSKTCPLQIRRGGSELLHGASFLIKSVQLTVVYSIVDQKLGRIKFMREINNLSMGQVELNCVLMLK